MSIFLSDDAWQINRVYKNHMRFCILHKTHFSDRQPTDMYERMRFRRCARF
ncbi:hypothetical protein OHAE_3102 [Ochrobactrum soli]|uniref:Uncharacterized protein n=1 Tax=Ochrobactrum soli TaxID=2448455 RepID=A0A2P9HHA8_9HYPH|nr:hypothetical protein OHAE_3102 [[Ochrobactrum] soli]